MITRKRSYPHPVLAPFTDDVTPSEFSLAVTVTSDADNHYLAVSYEYTNQTLAALIAAGDAVHAIHVECKRNFFRELFPVAGMSGNVAISATNLVGRVEVSGFVTATKRLSSYQVIGAHPDYGDASFEVEAGDVLAVAPTVVFDAYVDYDPLLNISSILSVHRSEDTAEGRVELDTTGDRIVATLAQNDFDRYTDLKGDPSLGPLLANQLVFPAILEAVHEIKSTSEEDFEYEMGRRWFRSIVKKLDELKVDLRRDDSSALRAAQELLRLPLRRSLVNLLEITESEGEP